MGLLEKGGETDFEPVRQRFLQLSTLPAQRHDWLHRVAHWDLAALIERDRLKRFLWSFFALETLTQRMSKQLYSSVVDSLHYESDSSAMNRSSTAIENLIWEHQRMPLSSRFSIMALAFYPDLADEDTSTFRRLKQARDNLAHGDPQTIDDLPVNEVRRLLERYIHAAAKHHIL